MISFAVVVVVVVVVGALAEPSRDPVRTLAEQTVPETSQNLVGTFAGFLQNPLRTPSEP